MYSRRVVYESVHVLPYPEHVQPVLAREGLDELMVDRARLGGRPGRARLRRCASSENVLWRWWLLVELVLVLLED